MESEAPCEHRIPTNFSRVIASRHVQANCTVLLAFLEEQMDNFNVFVFINLYTAIFSTRNELLGKNTSKVTPLLSMATT